MGPGAIGFPQLRTDRLDVVIILRQQAPQVLEYLHSLQCFPIDGFEESSTRTARPTAPTGPTGAVTT